MLPWDLEDWLTEEGDKVVRKVVAANTPDVLEPHERLVFELWLLDTEQRNGGLSQYFCNNGLAQWDMLSRLAAPALPSFSTFAARVNEVVGGSDDPYQALIDSPTDLDGWYKEFQLRLVTELKAVIQPEG